MSLKQDLSNFAEQMSAQAPKDVLEALGGFIGQLNESGLATNALKEGDVVPNFTLKDQIGNDVSLTTMIKDKPLVLSFNRGNWCPFCNLEFNAWQEEQVNMDKANFVMIMPQLAEKSAEVKFKKGLTYQILEDKGNEVANQFGLKFQLPENLQAIHKAFEMDIPAHNGDETYELPLAATYVIGQNQKIKFAYVNPNWMERAEPSEVLSHL